jgi:hypothetical protein
MRRLHRALLALVLVGFAGGLPPVASADRYVAAENRLASSSLAPDDEFGWKDVRVLAVLAGVAGVFGVGLAFATRGGKRSRRATKARANRG